MIPRRLFLRFLRTNSDISETAVSFWRHGGVRDPSCHNVPRNEGVGHHPLPPAPEHIERSMGCAAAAHAMTWPGGFLCVDPAEGNHQQFPKRHPGATPGKVFVIVPACGLFSLGPP